MMKENILDKKTLIGFEEALSLTLNHIQPLSAERVPLAVAVDRIVAADIRARVNSPSINGSLKDGYAVLSEDISSASPDNPVRLHLVGEVAAGGTCGITIGSGDCIRILTGARLPKGADAVVAEEFTLVEGQEVIVKADAAPGRNILPRGSDVSEGEQIVRKGSRLTPGYLGLAAAAGIDDLEVVKKPRVAIVATGDEVVAPGKPLSEGKLYASNTITLDGWCRRYGFETKLAIVPDNEKEIRRTFSELMIDCDALLTSGGAWTGDRDLVAKILDQLGWRKLFHRLKMGPGKAAGFGLLGNKPVFILPGGPPSNLMGFLQIALPGLMALAGVLKPGLPFIPVKLDREVSGHFAEWTQFIIGELDYREGEVVPCFIPAKSKSRLSSMAKADAIITIPDGEIKILAGTIINGQFLG